MPFIATSPALAHMTKHLSPAALDVFCKAATEAEQCNCNYNDCIRKGWEAVSDAGWRKPTVGKKWILLKDDGGASAGGDGPTGGSVHVDTPLGSKGRRKGKSPDGYDEDGVVKFDTEAQVFKVDDSLGLVFGWAIVCKKDGEDYWDSQNDHVPEESMLAAAADFMENSRVAKEMHEGGEIGPVVFAWPMTADIAKAMGIQTDTTGLMIAMKPPASTLQKFKDGDFTGFSIGGWRGEDEIVED